MATETTISRPAPFVEDIGKDLAKQAVAFTGVPVVSGGIGSLSKMTGETDAGFKARQDAARAFDVRQQNLAGLAPQVAGQDTLQKQHKFKLFKVWIISTFFKSSTSCNWTTSFSTVYVTISITGD